ncbi:MAG: hypothetical protein ACKOW2_05425 [Sphingobacteriaceae bacterium]
MSVSEIQLFNILKQKLGEKEAQTLVAFVQEEVKAELGRAKEVLATQKDLFGVKEELKSDIANFRSELLRTVYIVGLVQFLAIVGSVLMIFNFMLK